MRPTGAGDRRLPSRKGVIGKRSFRLDRSDKPGKRQASRFENGVSGMATTEHFGGQPIPKNAIRAMFALAIGSVALAAVGRMTDVGAFRASMTPVTESIALKFEDKADGSVLVTRHPDGRDLAVLAPGTNGFIRGTLRGLVRERKMRGIGPVEPFYLERHSNGDLSLRDPADGRQLELRGFGATNIGAFEKILQASEDRG